MINFFADMFGRPPPVMSSAGTQDAGALAILHAQAFRRGWSEQEFEALLADRHVTAHRATSGGDLVAFVISRQAADEAEILSIAVASAWRGRGLAGRLLDLHVRSLAGLGVATLFLEVDEGNAAALALYDRAYFREVGRRPAYYVGVDPGGRPPAAALVMRRNLA
jgi:[ribosomal protein S18]-alanine N-acetyltransferase